MNSWIDGASVLTDQRFDVFNPATGAVIRQVGNADRATIDTAISSSAGAFPTWSQTAPADRAQLLRTWAEVITDHTEEVAALASAESGKLFREARGEVGAGVAAIRWAADMAEGLGVSELPAPSPTRRHYTTKQAVGVVACITPWNFPIAAVLVKVGAAVAAGCTVVVKPSEETPLVAILLAELSGSAGIPAGVINVVATSEPAVFGEAVAASSDVRAVSFTGSTRVGKLLYEQCAGTVKRVSLELGGNAPFVVFGDADVDRAVSDAVNARFYNSGQICVGANRFFIHDSLYDEFAEKLTNRVAALRVGDGADDSSDIGPLINRKAKDHFLSLLDDAQTKGADVLVGGAHADADSLFVEPAVVVNATPDMDVHDLEIFGPMACLYRFTDADDVIAMANDTTAGLAAYAYSEDHERLAALSSRLEAGVVGLNTTQIFDSALPFGGVKESGIGREHGHDCLDEFLDIRSVSFETGDHQ